MPRIKLTVGYDGTRYHGWQKQPRLTTIQGQLEEVLHRLVQRKITVYGAGRTDAGVHALGQVAHFESDASFSSVEWVRALNALLPVDILVEAAEFVDATFHARFSAKEKEYRYQILNANCRSVWEHRTRWLVRSKLDVAPMRTAAKCLVGEHLFTSFCATSTETRDHRINLKQVEIVKRGERIDIILRAPRFLQHMVRSIVGFLVEVGRGRRMPDEVPTILAAADRRAAGQTAPPHGLFLVGITY